jgi:hypothetical protein
MQKIIEKLTLESLTISDSSVNDMVQMLQQLHELKALILDDNKLNVEGDKQIGGGLKQKRKKLDKLKIMYQNGIGYYLSLRMKA